MCKCSFLVSVFECQPVSQSSSLALPPWQQECVCVCLYLCLNVCSSSHLNLKSGIFITSWSLRVSCLLICWIICTLWWWTPCPSQLSWVLPFPSIMMRPSFTSNSTNLGHSGMYTWMGDVPTAHTRDAFVSWGWALTAPGLVQQWPCQGSRLLTVNQSLAGCGSQAG